VLVLPPEMVEAIGTLSDNILPDKSTKLTLLIPKTVVIARSSSGPAYL